MWRRLWQRYQTDYKQFNGPLLWLAALVAMPIIVAGGFSFLGASVFAVMLSLLVRLVANVVAPERNAAIDRACNRAFGPVVAVLILAFWWHEIYQATDGEKLPEIPSLATLYLILGAFVSAAVMAYALVFRIFGKVPFLQLGFVILLLITFAAYMLSGDRRCAFVMISGYAAAMRPTAFPDPTCSKTPCTDPAICGI